MNKFKRIALAVGVAAFAGSGVAQAQDRLSVLLDFNPWGLHAIVHLAQEKGWFEEEGLTVNVRDGRGSGNTIQLIAAGEADVGLAQLGPMAAARQASGADLKSIAGIIRKGDLAAVVDRDGDIKEVKDLKGKKLALFAASPFLPFLDIYFEAGGLTQDDVNLLFVDPSAMMASYTTGQADGVLTAGPFGQAVAEGVRPSSLVTAADAGISYPSYGYFALEDTIEEKSEALQKFVRVQLRALEYLYESDANIDEGVEAILSQRSDFKLDPVILKHQIEAYRDFVSTPNTEEAPLGWQSEEDWQATITSMMQADILDEGYQPSDFYTNEFITE